MSFNDTIHFERPVVVCTDSWWVGKTREQFYATAADRLPALRAAFGSAAVSTVPSEREQSFMDGVKKARPTL